MCDAAINCNKRLRTVKHFCPDCGLLIPLCSIPGSGHSCSFQSLTFPLCLIRVKLVHVLDYSIKIIYTTGLKVTIYTTGLKVTIVHDSIY